MLINSIITTAQSAYLHFEHEPNGFELRCNLALIFELLVDIEVKANLAYKAFNAQTVDYGRNTKSHNESVAIEESQETSAQTDNANHLRDAVDGNVAHHVNFSNPLGELIPDVDIPLLQTISAKDYEDALNRLVCATYENTSKRTPKTAEEYMRARHAIFVLITGREIL